jgi:hypothetical protein
MMSKFELIGRQVAESRMPPLAIVEQFDVFEDFASYLGSGVPLALIAQLEFECGEKTLGHRVIPAIPFKAHAAPKTMRRQQLLILGAGVLSGFKRSSQHNV